MLELPSYTALKTSLKSGVLFVTFHNPESPTINLWGRNTQSDLTDLVGRLEADNDTKVVVFNSDVPRFFVAHLDASILAEPNGLTIGAIEGKARGAGAEFLEALDMRFATKTETLLSQPEVGVGLTPGGGGAQFLTHLIGRGRAMEYILSAKDITADEAERIGWINKAFETSSDMYAYIEGLTSRIRLFPLNSLGEAKRLIDRASAPSFEDVKAEAEAFSRVVLEPLTQQAQVRSAEVIGSIGLLDAELNLGELMPKFYE
ncbi:ClpP/crotonase-like domain-containing protein [Fusarium oxysporum]|nr:ClpP/crotonase-like domain-containing protein [Fusarium oxysporum]